MSESLAKTARKGDLVRIHILVLEPDARADNLPEVTRRVPYEGWVKGFLLAPSAAIGDVVSIETFIGREVQGELVEINPRYDHDFGEPQPELSQIGPDAWRRLRNRGERL